MTRRLQELDLSVSPSQPNTPKDGNCMMSYILDQLSFDPYQRSFAKSPQQLRMKILDYGYDLFIRTGKLVWSFDPEIGSPEQWKERMSQDGEWGDEIFLHLAANVLSLDVIVIPAIRESSIQHIQQRRLNREENVLLTFLSSNASTIDESRNPILQESCTESRLEMEDGSWTESTNIEIVVSEETVSSYERYSDQ